MRRLSIIAVVLIGIGVVVMVGFQNSNSLSYARYSPKDPLIDVTFDHPEGWVVFERRGAYGAFIQAQILESLGEKEKKERKACSVVITIYPKSKAEFMPLTNQGLCEDILKKRLALKGSKLLDTSNSASIAGIDATDHTLAYSIFDIPLKANAEPIPIVERVMCVQKGENFYTVRLEIGEENFEQYNKIFDTILKSIQFRS